MAALPNGMPPGANPAIKAKISSSSAAHAPKETPTDPSQASPGGYDPNAYLYDANSWPEYTIHDSDYSNFRSVEMNNMNGENTDMPNYEKITGRRPAMPGYQSFRENEGEEEFQGPKFSHDKTDSTQFNDEVKQEHGDDAQKKPPSKGSQADKANNGGAESAAGKAKPAADGGNKGGSKSDNNSKPAQASAQQQPQTPAVVKAEHNAPAAKDAPSQKQPQPAAAKAAPAKLDASVVQMAASLPPKAIASLVSRLVGNGKAVGAAVGQVQGQHQGQGQGQSQGQIQKNVAGTVSQSPIPQDINPAEELTQSATQLQRVTKPKKH